MYNQLKIRIATFVQEESGQGINEYAAIMAFVSMVFMLVFSLTQGALADTIMECFSSMAGQLNKLANAPTN
jgi:Flp pilus assembly pilin Flp